jgi:hypothetical protein
MEYAYMVNVYAGQVLAVKVAVNCQQLDMDRKQIYFYLKIIIIV